MNSQNLGRLRIVIGITLLAVASIGVGLFLTQTAPNRVSGPKTVTIDLQKTLPKKLELLVGDEILFENDLGKFTAKETDGKGQLFQALPHNTFNQAASYSVIRKGVGTIEVEMSDQGLLTKQTIEVTVKTRG